MKKSYMQGILILSLHARVVVYKIADVAIERLITQLTKFQSLKKKNLYGFFFVLGL